MPKHGGLQVGERWGKIRVVRAQLSTRQVALGSGVVSEERDTIIELECACGLVLELWQSDFPGKRKLRDCGNPARHGVKRDLGKGGSAGGGRGSRGAGSGGAGESGGGGSGGGSGNGRPSGRQSPGSGRGRGPGRPRLDKAQLRHARSVTLTGEMWTRIEGIAERGFHGNVSRALEGLVREGLGEGENRG